MLRAAMTAVSTALLRLRVHLDAMLADPMAYATATRWRVLGKKLRARHQFAALMGQTPRAYALWIATRGRFQDDAVCSYAWPNDWAIFVIDCRASAEGLDHTLRSIAQQAAGAPRIVLLGSTQPTSPDCVVAIDTDALALHLHSLMAERGQEVLWVIPVDAGDRLSARALAAYGRAKSASPDAALLYADDDLIDTKGTRQDPLFKPQWNPELFKHHDYVTGACCFKVGSCSIDAGWPLSALPLDGAAPVHVPLVLHHRKRRPEPVIPSAPSVPADLPHVSIVIPTRNGADLLQTCMDGLAATDYPSFDITIIDNDSDDPTTLALLDELKAGGVRVVPWSGAFNFAAMHNAVVPQLSGPLICLLNNDIEILAPDWLALMAVQALREDVGAVGARLLYPDGSIQHAGIVTGVGGGAGHAHRYEQREAHGYFSRARLPQFITAVTAACLLVRKDRFEAVGGFDAANFAVAFNDVDLCLKLNARGWQSFYEPRACLVHHESKSRGLDSSGPKKARFDAELQALKRIWGTDTRYDPFHHPELSRFGERFVVRL